MDFDVLRLQTQFAAARAKHRVCKRRRDVHVRDRIAELIRLRLLQLDGAFADDWPLMPAGARRRQRIEDSLKQFALKQPESGGRKLVATLATLKALPLRRLAQVIF